MHPLQSRLLQEALQLKVAAAAPVLWKYTDPEGKEFYLTEKKTTVRSPYSGKSFSVKPERSTISEVSKDLREEAKADKTASTPEQWELGAEILDQKEKHPAIQTLKKAYDEILKSVDEADKRSKNLKKVGVGKTEDPTLVMSHVVPAIEELAEEAQIVARQLTQRLGGR